ncbi:MAG: hypothetical protein KF858_03920 [Candidatus Sumerlaeia bacterium]|nr:hypothetical protein [Candidatus Sumerlaeia bacterium]
MSIALRSMLLVVCGVPLFCLSAARSGAQSALPITNTADLPMARGFHGSAILGEYLYLFGGAISEGTLTTENQNVTEVWRARIGPDKNLSDWSRTTPIPGPRFYTANSTLALNDVVYIMGGSDKILGGTTLKTAIWSKPLPNGTLTPWQTSEPIPTEVGYLGPAAISTPGHLHQIGGVGGDTVHNTVWTIPVYPDGSLARWEPGPPLPTPLWFHAAGVVAGRVYVWGGLNSTADERVPLPYIFSAAIRSNGKIGPWRTERVMLPVGFYSAPAAVAGPYLMSFMPRYQGGVLSSDVWFTRITPRGMDPWTRRPATIPNRVYHALAPNYRMGTIYITGGRHSGGQTQQTTPLLKNASYFQLNEQARREAEQSYMAAQTAHANSVSALAAQLEGGSRAQGPDRLLTYLADQRLQEGAVPGFMTITEARAKAEREGKPLVMYFLIKDAQPCVEQRELLVSSPEFAALTEVVCFAWIDATEYPQLCQQIGIYRAPTWVFYTARGDELGRRIGVMTPVELAQGILRLQQ